MQRIILTLFSVSLSIFLLVRNASAIGPVFWRVNTRAEIEKGNAQGISIADNGTLTLAPAVTEIFNTKQAYIWSATADAAGNIYLGTGHEGRIFKVDAKGKGELIYKAPELDIMALALDARGNLYAGTSPDGKVYRITPDGEVKVFFEPKAKYIWSLAFDQRGQLWVGTGDKGIIYRVAPDGRGEPYVKTTQTNITALGVDRAGNIIAGTDPGGLVLRISPDGRVFTLFDSAQREVRELAFGSRGELYALLLAESVGSDANNAASSAASSSSSNQMTGNEGITITISDTQTINLPSLSSSDSAILSSSTSSDQAKSVLYRIDANGAAESLWESREAVGFAVALSPDGKALVGTSNKGQIYSIGMGQKPLLLAQSSEAQIARFVRAGEYLYAATSNFGKLYRISSELSMTGVYTSAVRDAQTVATWGRISWVGEGEIELQTRSGNTAMPDATWSDWSSPIRTSDSELIKSPSARFIQWRGTLKRPSSVAPRLREVTISYLPRNLSPRINSITILPVGVALQALPQSQADPGAEKAGIDQQALGNAVGLPPRRVFQQGAVSLQWQAEDPNGDTLEYALYYRSAASSDFYPLKTKLRDNYFTIEANELPDGRYVFKVVASDEPSNPKELMLTDDQETESIEIDNMPPAVTVSQPIINGEAVTVNFQVSDATSIIRRAEYQLDGGEWRAIYPVDGIADTQQEEFKVKLALPDVRPHVIAFRTFDSNANVGNAQVIVRAAISR